MRSLRPHKAPRSLPGWTLCWQVITCCCTQLCWYRADRQGPVQTQGPTQQQTASAGAGRLPYSPWQACWPSCCSTGRTPSAGTCAPAQQPPLLLAAASTDASVCRVKGQPVSAGQQPLQPRQRFTSRQPQQPEPQPAAAAQPPAAVAGKAAGADADDAEDDELLIEDDTALQAAALPTESQVSTRPSGEGKLLLISRRPLRARLLCRSCPG